MKKILLATALLIACAIQCSAQAIGTKKTERLTFKGYESGDYVHIVWTGKKPKKDISYYWDKNISLLDFIMVKYGGGENTATAEQLFKGLVIDATIQYVKTKCYTDGEYHSQPCNDWRIVDVKVIDHVD